MSLSTLLKKPSILMVILTIVQACVVMGVEGYIYSLLSSEELLQTSEGKQRGFPIYLIIFILSQVFQLALVYDAVKDQNIIQMIGVVVFNFCCFMYSILQIFQIRQIVSKYNVSSEIETINDFYNHLFPWLVTVSVVLFACGLLFIFLTWKLFQEFGWHIYKKIGADLTKKKMYRSYHIFLMLLKMDVFFFLGFALQFAILVLNNNDIEKGLTIAAIPISLAILVGAVYAVVYEKKPAMMMFAGALVLAIAYFIFKTMRIYTDPDRVIKYANVSIYLTVFAVFSLLICMTTLVFTVICYRNFDKGLKMYLQPGAQFGRSVVVGRLDLEGDDEAPGAGDDSVMQDVSMVSPGQVEQATAGEKRDESQVHF